MACGMIVAPRIDAASSTEFVPSNRGTSPLATAPASGGAKKTPAVKPTVMISTSAKITRSNVRGPRRVCTVSTIIEMTPVITPPVRRGRPKSRLSATAPPMISARSVAIATSSACSQYSRLASGRCRRAPRSSGRLVPVTMPSLAERYWISQAITLPARTTHTSR